MDKTLLLSIIVVGLNVPNVLTQVSGPTCESNKAWFGDPNATKTLPDFCTQSHQYALKGDFNGDGRMDIMCHDSIIGKKWIYYGDNNGYSVVGWSKDDMAWCIGAVASLYIGDFNGDSRDDMLCHMTTGYVFIAYANEDGHFTATSWDEAMGFCTGNHSKLFIGDFNGDCKSDMLCYDGGLGRTSILYATADGTFDNSLIWHTHMESCLSLGGKLFVGDFNGDHRDDMLCYDDMNVTGNMFTAYAKWDGSFDQIDNTNNMGWCVANGCTVLVGKASRDQRDDLVCHCKSPSTEPIRVRFPAFDDGFETFRQWRRSESWCGNSTEMLLVGRLKPGHCGSLICIDKATGQYSIAFS